MYLHYLFRELCTLKESEGIIKLNISISEIVSFDTPTESVLTFIQIEPLKRNTSISTEASLPSILCVENEVDCLILSRVLQVIAVLHKTKSGSETGFRE